jgi:cell wall-associated NlpC family hydrolase
MHTNMVPHMVSTGAGYRWGGAPAVGTGNWDCSSFVNWVVGHDCGMAIPGYAAGSYGGAEHGPATLSWLAWSGCTTIGHSGSAAQPGDLAVWQTHMGICTGPNTMISAQDPQNGTRISAIDGFISGELLYIRRLAA